MDKPSVIAEHVARVKASEVSLVTAKAQELERAGRDIVRLSAGEPDFPTPDHIKLACIRALCENKTKYPPVIGLPELREAICLKLARDNELQYAPAQTIVSAGAKQVLYNAMTATLNPGDEVILFAPYWMSYVGMVQLARATPVFVRTTAESGFMPTAQDLEQAITPRTRWIFLNSPCNPSGAVYGPAQLKAIADVLRRHPDVWILSDDIYEFIVFDGIRYQNLLNVAPDLKDRFLLVNGLSKAYSMTGWRLGYAAGPKLLIDAMFKIQSQSTSGANHIGQWAAVTALTGDHAFIDARKREYQQRRDLVVSLANGIPGLRCKAPQGAFYCLVSCAEYIGRKTPQGAPVASDDDFADYLLNEAGVAMIPGTPFGLQSYVRVSFATSKAKIEDAFGRIRSALARLH